jgi:hypothetical protein
MRIASTLLTRAVNIVFVASPIRDERGRYLKGIPGGSGRPLGSHNKITEDFLADCFDPGSRTANRVIAKRPEV